MAYLLWQVAGLSYAFNFVASAKCSGKPVARRKYLLRQVYHEKALIALSHHLGTPSTFDAGHPQAL